MLWLLASPFIGIFWELVDGYEFVDGKVNGWFVAHGQGPGFARLVKLAPIVITLAVIIGVVSQ